MLILLLEFMIMGAGIAALVKGELPRFIFGRKLDYFTIDPERARLIGMILILPLPITFFTNIVYGMWVGKEIPLLGLLERVFFAGAIVAAWVLWRVWREEIDRGEPPKGLDALR